MSQPLTEAVFYILVALTEPLHGYGIMLKVSDMTHGRVSLAAGTLYGALSALANKGWLDVDVVDDQKRYRLTDAGLAALRDEQERLTELAAHGRAALTERTTHV
ncbi:MAG: PadR family transcriptional regulator [Propionibacteriaceae bacterium]|nr:PadR family transcriptional regulator [Propionibacteriaceae bacterium]